MSEWYRLDENKNVVPLDDTDTLAFRASRAMENRLVARTKVYEGRD